MASTPIVVLSELLVTDLLQHLLKTSLTTRLIVCGTRTEFLVQLSAATRNQSDSNVETRHDLLTITIGLLANSSKIQLAFCPSLESLRAYLAILPLIPGSEKSLEMDQFDKPQVLAILDLVALHTTTTEFSAQGLSRTFATAVESAYHAGIGLMLCECSNAVDPSSSDWGARLWNTQVPLLNGSLRIRDDSGAWGGHAVSVRRVAERWFKFGTYT